MNDRSLVRGLFLMAIALVFGLSSFRYSTGSFGRAGPGLFPLLVSSMLFLLGLATVIRARFVAGKPLDFQLRNIALILASLVGFAIISEHVNMIAGIVFMVFCASFAGSSKYSITRNLKISAGLIAIALAFEKLLGLQLPLY